jgi:two-component system, sensor histidine kinase
MFFKNKNKKVSSKFLMYSMVVVSISIIVVAFLYIIIQIREFKNDSESSRYNYMESQKSVAKNETEKVVDYINYTRMFIEDKMKTDLRERTIQAWLIIDNIYRANKGRYSTAQISKMVNDALRPIRFNRGRGYFFMVSMDGTELLYPVAPQFEGKNLLDLKDDKGNFVIRDELKVISESDEGYVTDYWMKPGEGKHKLFPKISYIKRYADLDAYVGCGEYLDNVERDVQEEVLQKIKTIRFGKDGYIFVNTFDGKAVIIDSDKYKAGDNVWDLTDPDGIKVIQEEYKIAQRKEGGFLSYKWKKLNSSKVISKITFVKGVPEWEWVVGAGIYVDEIDVQIAKDRSVLYANLAIQIIFTFCTLLGVLIILFFITRKLAANIDGEFNLFAQKLSLAVNEGLLLNKEDFELMDLQIVAEKINEVVKNKATTEAALKDSEMLFRTIFENVPVMLGVIDLPKQHFKWNSQIRQMFDVKAISLDNISSFKKWLTESSINKNFEELVTDGQGQFWELELNTKKGVRIQNWAHLVTNNDEIVLVGYDITEIRESQTKLKALNATKDKFFSIIAHDLRGPIGSLNSFLDLFTQDEYKLTDEELKTNMEVMKIASNKTYELLENLLTWARSQMDDITFDPKLNHLKEVVDLNISLFSSIAKGKDIQLISNVNNDIPFIFDFEMMSAVLRNLINNALKFTNAKGIIIVSARIEGKNVAVTVEDTGVGMPSDICDKIFDISSQISSTSGTSGEIGTGLGLILCKEFVEKQGGTISVKSELGKGSSFTFTIPIK